MFQRWALAQTLPLILGLAATRAHAAEAPVGPAAAWATSYLVNSVFLAEYDSVLATFPEASKDRTTYLASPAGVALARRAAFAIQDMDEQSQGSPNKTRLKTLLGEPAFASRLDTNAVTETFSGLPLRDLWLRIARSYGMPSPSCPIDFDEVKAFAAHQKKLLAGDHGANPNVLLKPLAQWTLPKVQCLVFALMASTGEAKAKDGFEPLEVIRALSQTASPMARDLSLRALLAVRYLELGQYSETLSVLMDLTDMDGGYRLPYEMVQRIFSIRQRGEGAVALQGI